MECQSENSLPSIDTVFSRSSTLSRFSETHHQSTEPGSEPTSKPLQTKTRRHVPDPERAPRGILATSVIIDIEELEASQLPLEVAITSITMAELSAGPHATDDPDERSRRIDRLQRAEAAFDPLPFDINAARAYGRVFAAVASSGRKARGQRAVDLLIVASALSTGLPLFTRNGEDFDAVKDIVEIVVV